MKNPFRYFNSSPEIIRLTVMMYVRYPLSLRQVEDLLFERGIDICHETVRFWWNRFGPMFAAEIRKKRSAALRALPQWRWHLDDVFVKINGEMHFILRIFCQTSPMRTLTAFLCLTLAVLLFSAGEGFALPPCPEDQNQRFHNCFGTYTTADGEKYVGEWKYDKLHGQGTYTYADGTKYIGEYRDNKRNGQGTFTFGSKSELAGDKYVGEFRDNKFHGQGTYTYADGTKYIGEFRDNKYHGQGTLTYADGRVEEGVWENNEFLTALPPCPEDPNQRFDNCFGTFTAADGDKYVGEWKDDKLHGQGTYTYADGTKYIGEFRDNKYHGQGTLTYADGRVEEGVWENNEFLYARKGSPPVTALPPCPEDPNQRFHNCFGTFTNADGDKYVGEWKDDKKHGQGTYTYANGDKYVGEYRDNKAHGQGTWTPANGDKYVGEFRDGKMHGHGATTYGPSSQWAGGKYVGEYRDDKYHGQGTYTFADGRVLEGVWENDEFQYAREGSPPVTALPPCPEDQNQRFHNCFGTFTFADGDKYVGEWKDDKLHGQGTFTFADGSKYVGEYRDGERNGHFTVTYPDGAKFVGEYRDDKKNGQGATTFADGGKYVGEYRDGKYHGQGTYTYADGRVEEGVWENDEFLYARKGSPPVIAENPPRLDSSGGSDPDEVVSASSGSGFAVSYDGYVITNNHVIDGCQRVQIHHKGKSIPATVVTFDTNNDLALLQGDFRPTTVFALSKERPELLQDIYVAGYPFGKKISTSVKVTKGIISSLAGIGNNFSNIQIDAALQPGNSGGPILNDKGHVVGVAVAKLDIKKVIENWGVIPENTNFGIKSSVVRILLDSNNISLPEPNTETITKSKLSKMISDGTYYLSCWMTYAQIEMMRSRKVFFPVLD